MDAERVAMVVLRSRHVYYVNLMAFVYYICDWAHTFEWEVAYMWEKGNWSLIKVAYFLARYTGLVDWPLIFIYNHASELTPKECNTLFYAAILIGLGGSGFGETLMFLRVYVLSGCSKKMGLYLVFHFYLFLGMIFTFLILSLKSLVYVSSPAPDQITCYFQSGNNAYIAAAFGIILVHHISAMILSLYLGLPRFGQSKSPLLAIIYRDGTFYFIAIALVTAVNLGLAVSGPKEYWIMFLWLQRTLKATLSTRVVLKMRETAKRSLHMRGSKLTLGPRDTYLLGAQGGTTGVSELEFSSKVKRVETRTWDSECREERTLNQTKDQIR